MAGKQPDKDACAFGADVSGASGVVLAGPLGAAVGAALTAWLGHEAALEAAKKGL